MHILHAGRGLCSVALTGVLMRRLGVLGSAASAGQVVVDNNTATNLRVREDCQLDEIHVELPDVDSLKAFRLCVVDAKQESPPPKIPQTNYDLNALMNFVPGCVSLQVFHTDDPIHIADSNWLSQVTQRRTRNPTRLHHLFDTGRTLPERKKWPDVQSSDRHGARGVQDALCCNG